MPKIGRNDPCPCGSGTKYKHCHLPIEEAAQAEQLRMRRAVDTLLPKIIAAARSRAADVPDAFARFWNAKYSPEHLAELDDLEGRGAERFLTWFAFDYPLDSGRTLVEDLAAPGAGAGKAHDTALDLSDEEARLLGRWMNVRLQPYAVEGVRKGQGMHLTSLVEGTPFEVEDHAASRRVELGEVLVAHLLPAGDYYYIGGAAAHLTEDTREKMREFLGLHLEAFQRDHADATW